MNAIHWRSEWNAIAARIGELLQAGEFFYRSITTYTSDSLGTSSQLLVQAQKIYDLLETYRDRHRSALADQALESINRFLEDHQHHFKFAVPPGGLPNVLPYLQFRLAALSSFKVEMGFYFSS